MHLFRPATIIAVILLIGGAALLGVRHSAMQASLFLLGGALGVALLHASFGFAGAFRRLLAEGRGAGLRAQMVMLAVAVVLFLPVLAEGSFWGQPVRGFVFPVGLSLLLGAFLFGVGMQIGGGCASGTLYTAAGGQGARMWLTLASFVAGATLAAYGAEHWEDWPSLPPLSLPGMIGTLPAIGVSLVVFALVWFGSIWLERRRQGSVEVLSWRGGDFLRGPWPLLWGAVALALLNFATLLLAGRPWAITAAFPLWGSRLVELLGWDVPAFWLYWEDPTRTEALLRPLLADRTTVMDLGLMAGAFGAAALAGHRADWRWPRPQEALASLFGGILLGIGAVMAFGCNISAYFSGIASGSLHGWAWIGPALLGNWVGLKIRPLFSLDRGNNEMKLTEMRGAM
ncbi:YeeE/YedE family protein [Sabulicella rubraurantiaca]|uniref:YeeE/YedE family protein n=1 Tax=Sabulicella rubraurantiaca TaxID=2811429 RepID=UPI001A95C4D9|nr:YeeE/YedE family protein [Sabulicella rubraurantiaca]